MDVRWVAYVGSGLLAAVSLVPTVFRAPAPTRSPAPAPVQAAAPDPAMLDVERQTSRLREYASVAPEPRSVRDPFRFGHRPPPRSRVSPSYVQPRAVAAPSSLPPPVPEPAPLQLIGMAERDSGDGAERIAIIAAFNDVHLVRVGDRIGGRFTVLAVGADAVELEDAETRTLVRLGLR
jgi:hypothetical protein